MNSTYSPTILKRAYFSSWHLNSSIIFLDKAAEIELAHMGRNKFDVNHTSYVMSSIMSSVAFLEAVINEIYEDVSKEPEPHDSYIRPINENARKIMKENWGSYKTRKVLTKYQFALKASNLTTFLEDEDFYQDVELSIDLRHELTHYHPQTFGGGTQHEFEQKLEGKFDLNPLIHNPEEPFFPDRCLGKGCANWVLKSCLSLADEFFKRMDITPNYQLNKESWYDLDSLREKLNTRA